MFANNEIGTIQPIKEVGEIAETRNTFPYRRRTALGNVSIDVKRIRG